MVEIIGIATMVALSWLLASSMANESESEQRRLSRQSDRPVAGEEPGPGARDRHAA